MEKVEIKTKTETKINVHENIFTTKARSKTKEDKIAKHTITITVPNNRKRKFYEEPKAKETEP